MLFPTPPLGRWLKTLPTILLKIWLVGPRPNAKNTKILYPYILGGFNCSDPYGIPKVNIPVLIRYHIIRLLCGGYYNINMIRTFNASIWQYSTIKSYSETIGINPQNDVVLLMAQEWRPYLTAMVTSCPDKSWETSDEGRWSIDQC